MCSRLGAWELAGQGFPAANRLIEPLLGGKALCGFEQDLGHAAIERVRFHEGAPGCAGLVVGFAHLGILGHQKLGVDNRALSVGRLGAVGVLRQVGFEGLGGLVELLLPLQNLADLKLGGHLKPGLLGGGLGGFGTCRFFGNQGPERRQRGLAFAACKLGRGNVIGGLEGQRAGRVRLAEPLQGGGPQVQAGVIAGGGKSVGAADLEQRPGPDGLTLGCIHGFQFPGQVGPGEPGRQRLTGRKLGLGQQVAGVDPVGSLAFGIFFEVKLKVFDGPAGVAGLEAGLAHRFQQLSAEFWALGQVTSLAEHGVGPLGVGRQGWLLRL